MGLWQFKIRNVFLIHIYIRMFTKNAFKRLVKQCLAEVIVEDDAVRKNAMFDKDKKCTHPNGFEFSGKTPGTGYEVCRMCGTRKPSSRKQVPRLGMFESQPPQEQWKDTFGKKMSGEFVVGESGNQLELTPTGHDDEWSRPVYKGSDGELYVDVNCGSGTPSIHSISAEGEPEFPVKNYKIVAQSPAAKRNRLCPRCGNSKPELMTKTPEGKMSCNSCHWEDNPSEPYNPPKTALAEMIKNCVLEVLRENLGEGFDPQSNAGPNGPDDTGGNPYKKWNSDMRKMEEDAPVRKSTLTPKSITVIQKWCKLGHREASKKIIDYILSKKIGLTSDDLADTTTFANGLDAMEEALNVGNYQSAYDIGKDTADEMIEDEGGAGMNETLNVNEDGDGFNSMKGDNPAATMKAQMFPYADQNDKMRQMETKNPPLEVEHNDRFDNFRDAKKRADETGKMVFWWVKYYLVSPEEYNESYGYAKYVSKQAEAYFKEKHRAYLKSKHNLKESEGRICTSCNGSGEGMADGTKCSSCGGSGDADHKWGKKSKERDPDDERDYRRDRD